MRSPAPFGVEQLTPGTSAKKRVLIPKRSSLDSRVGGTPATPGHHTPLTPVRGGGHVYGGASSYGLTPGGGLDAFAASPLIPQQQLTHRRVETWGAQNDDSSHYGMMGGNSGNIKSGVVSRSYVPNLMDLTSSLNYECWVVVIGLSEGKLAARTHFSHCGQIVNAADSAGNWTFLEFNEPAGAERAVRMNGKIIASGTIICVERLTPSRAAELNFKISSKIDGDVNRQEFPAAADRTTPNKYLRPPKKRESICSLLMKFFGIGGAN